jgi:hypothetical protein
MCEKINPIEIITIEVPEDSLELILGGRSSSEYESIIVGIMGVATLVKKDGVETRKNMSTSL